MAEQFNTRTAAELIKLSKEKPPEPVIVGVMTRGDIAAVHGPEESFKSALTIQMGCDLAAGTPFLNRWKVARPYRVGLIETEMHEGNMGQRLAQMFSDRDPPALLCFFAASDMKTFRRKQGVNGKLEFIREWCEREGIEVLIIDTANDFFRGKDNPNDEAVVGAFFDGLRNLGLHGVIVVRHDRKKRDDDEQSTSTNDQIRGSAEWKEDPELILAMNRKDKRVASVELDFGKLRYGVKPPAIELWFDAGSFTLTALSPIIAVLLRGPMHRSMVLAECKTRFSISERKTDDMIKALGDIVKKTLEGHNKVLSLDWQELRGTEDWAPYLGGVRDMQDCISCTPPQKTNSLDVETRSVV